MKASSFMIGDIVNVYPSNLPIHIAAVHNRKVAYHSVKHRLEWVRESLLRPIPLTSEILEKNGFLKDENCRLILPMAVVLWSDNGRTMIRSLINDKHFYGWCHNVHEMQQALRLLNIEKEIQL